MSCHWTTPEGCAPARTTPATLLRAYPSGTRGRDASGGAAGEACFSLGNGSDLAWPDGPVRRRTPNAFPSGKAIPGHAARCGRACSGCSHSSLRSLSGSQFHHVFGPTCREARTSAARQMWSQSVSHPACRRVRMQWESSLAVARSRSTSSCARATRTHSPPSPPRCPTPDLLIIATIFPQALSPDGSAPQPASSAPSPPRCTPPGYRGPR